MKIQIKEIKFNSVEYEQEVNLRNRILREPLGLRLKKEDLEKEGADIHIGAFLEGTLVGCLILSPLPEGRRVRMRQVAVSEEMQRTGVGRLLVEDFERVARQAGFQWIELRARQGAVLFYQKLGYEICGQPLTEAQIVHVKMQKKIIR